MDVVIVSACRTAIGKHGGALKTVDAVALTIPVMQELIRRSSIDSALIEDVIWGCNYQKTYKENNLARVAAIKAGLPVSVPGITGTSQLYFLHVCDTDGLLPNQGWKRQKSSWLVEPTA